jgi:acetyl-CoA carboxylase biotin carboxylase subunit
VLLALDETVITGVPTTGPFHKLILNHHAFKEGKVDTGFIPKYIDELKTPPPTSKVRRGSPWHACHGVTYVTYVT